MNKIYQINQIQNKKFILTLKYHTNQKYILGFTKFDDVKNLCNYNLESKNITFINKNSSKVKNHLKITRYTLDNAYSILENSDCLEGIIKVKKLEIDNKIYEIAQSHIYSYINYLQEDKGVVFINEKIRETDNEILYHSILIEPISKYKFMDYL